MYYSNLYFSLKVRILCSLPKLITKQTKIILKTLSNTIYSGTNGFEHVNK